ncbi:MAG: hypothetical protein AB8G99_19540 [Planctomycetaceae bacterium]
MKTVLLFAFVLSFHQPVFAQNAKNVFEAIGELLGGGPIEAVAKEEVENAKHVAIKAERRGRLEANTAAMLAWIDAVCEPTEKQRETIASLLKTEVDRSQRVWLVKPDRGEAAGDRDFIPFEFNKTIRKVTHIGRVEKGIAEALDDVRRPKFEAAWLEREESLRYGFISFGLLLLDGELFLTPKQREPIRDELATMFGKSVFHGTFGFYSSSWPFERATFLKRETMKDLLGEVRFKRFRRLTASKGQGDRSVSITMGNGNEEQVLREAIDAQPERLAEAMAVRIEHWQELGDITPVQARRLKLAAKGAGKRVVKDWAERSDRQMQSIREQFGEQQVSWGMSLPRIVEVERQSIWKSTVSKVFGTETKPKTKDEHVEDGRQAIKSALANILGTKTSRITKPPKPRTERQEFQRKAVIDYMVSTLDQEIWLLGSQRKELRELVDKSLADFEKYRKYTDYCELQMMADVLLATPYEDLAGLLKSKQLAAWKSVRGQYKTDANQGSVTVVYKYGDFQIPRVDRRQPISKWPSDKNAVSKQ